MNRIALVLEYDKDKIFIIYSITWNKHSHENDYFKPISFDLYSFLVEINNFSTRNVNFY
jgi:hypothetical protein